MKIIDWFKSKPLWLNGGIISAFIFFIIGILVVISLPKPVPGSPFVNIIPLKPEYGPTPLLFKPLYKFITLDNMELWALIIPSIEGFIVGVLIGLIIGMIKSEGDINLLGFLKKYHLGAIVGGLYGYFGAWIYFSSTFAGTNFILLVLSYISGTTHYLVNSLAVFTYSSFYIYPSLIFTILINIILWIFLGMCIQKVIKDKISNI